MNIFSISITIQSTTNRKQKDQNIVYFHGKTLSPAGLPSLSWLHFLYVHQGLLVIHICGHFSNSIQVTFFINTYVLLLASPICHTFRYGNYYQGFFLLATFSS